MKFYTMRISPIISPDKNLAAGTTRFTQLVSDENHGLFKLGEDSCHSRTLSSNYDEKHLINIG